MAQLLAPYNNSMRLGQGFNSYTQQICLDKAVTQAPRGPRSERQAVELTHDSDRSTPDTSEGSLDYVDSERAAIMGAAAPIERQMKVMPWVKPQIVTYKSHFVDKLSDVTEAMNISGSLSIKTATIGGKANGNYIDSDKFKSSDINFHLQVKVTNQIIDAPDYSVFNKLDSVDQSSFPEIYGDSFISGWEEGGELNAVISMKVHDKSKIFKIKAHLEAEMTTPSIAGKVELDADIDKTKLSKETETTITVNWSGGGSIKDPIKDWNVATLKEAAAAFPDLVALTPQRTYAILTKYTALASFHAQNTNFSPLDYESAGIYTKALLDHYMDYKVMWKSISLATHELKGNRATIEYAQPTEESLQLAKVRPLPPSQVDAKAPTVAAIEGKDVSIAPDAQRQLTLASSEPESDRSLAKSIALKRFDSNPVVHAAFSPTFVGLIAARKVCRFEMAKIVNEVDLVAKNPKLSTDTERDSYFLNPLIFEQLLPVVRSLSPEDAKRRVKDPNAAVLLGYVPHVEEAIDLPPVYRLEDDIGEYALRLQDSIQRVGYKSSDYLIQGLAGIYKERAIHSQAHLINDLDRLDPTFRPTKISVWSADGIVKGIEVEHAKGEKRSHGACAGDSSHTLDLNPRGSEIIIEVILREGIDQDGQTVIASIALATSDCQIFDTAIEQEALKPGTTTQPESENKATDTEADAASKSETGTASTSQSKQDSKPAESAVPPKIVKTHTWTRPEDGQWSLRGFLSFSYGPTDKPSIICTLGIVWGKDAFVPVPTASISATICNNLLGLSSGLQANIRKFKTLRNYSDFANKFLMGRSISTEPNASTAAYFNALDFIDIDWTLKTIAFESNDGKLKGLRVLYSNGRQFDYGNFEKETWSCDVKSSLVVVKLSAGRIEASGPSYIETVEFIRSENGGHPSAWPLAVSTLRYLGNVSTRVTENVAEVVEQAPKQQGMTTWSIRGFYGEHHEGIITRLGVIWGRG